MTTGQALYEFWNSFGIPAYAETSVPEDTVYPWITYENTVTSFDDNGVTAAVNIWYHTESEAQPNAKVKEISDRIGLGGVTIPAEDGFIWIKKGSPWIRSLTDNDDNSVKRRFLNVRYEFCLTE